MRHDLLRAASKIRGGGGPITDPLFNEVVFLANYESDLSDVMGHPPTNVGASVTGGYLYTDGVSQYVSYGNNMDLSLYGIVNWTVEIIIAPDSPVGGGSYIQKAKYATNGTWPEPGYAIRNIGASTLRAYFDTTGTLAGEKYIDYTHRSTGGPLHVAMTKQGTSGTLWVDGVSVGSITGLTYGGISYSTHPLEIGRFDYNIGPIYQQTTLYGARITIANRYTANFTPPLSFIETGKDYSGLVNVLTGLSSGNFEYVYPCYITNVGNINNEEGLNAFAIFASSGWYTADGGVAANEGGGLICTLSSPAAVKLVQLSGYTPPQASTHNYKIEAMVSSVWQTVAIVPCKSAGQEGPPTGPYYARLQSFDINESGSVVSNKWKITISDWQNDVYTNMYFGELKMFA